jgi:hypothetical protein
MPEAISQEPAKLEQIRLQRLKVVRRTFKTEGVQDLEERFSKNRKSVELYTVTGPSLTPSSGQK